MNTSFTYIESAHLGLEELKHMISTSAHRASKCTYALTTYKNGIAIEDDTTYANIDLAEDISRKSKSRIRISVHEPELSLKEFAEISNGQIVRHLKYESGMWRIVYGDPVKDEQQFFVKQDEPMLPELDKESPIPVSEWHAAVHSAIYYEKMDKRLAFKTKSRNIFSFWK